nr:hypothetical protein [Xanthomonas sp. LMC-A-07]
MAQRADSPLRRTGAPPACRFGEAAKARETLECGRFAGICTGSNALSRASRGLGDKPRSWRNHMAALLRGGDAA